MGKTILFLSALLLIAILMPSCKKGGSGNQIPVAVAGSDIQVFLPEDSVQLDGFSSKDPDGTIAAWQWAKLSGPYSYELAQPALPRTVLRKLVEGEYTFELKVTDDQGSFGMDTIKVNVIGPTTGNSPPLACAGTDQIITLPINTVLLNAACSTDPDNNIDAFSWKQVSGPSFARFGNPNFSQSQVNYLTDGVYLFSVKVTDKRGLFSYDTVKVTVNPEVSAATVDIYISGSDNGFPVYWKNGLEVFLPGPEIEANATAVLFKNGDIYISGSEGDFFTMSSMKAKYWKNGQEFYLPSSSGAGATAIAVSGTDVYVAGWEYIGNKSAAKYWKNGSPVMLTNGGNDAVATGIAVSGNDVYVCGYDGETARYWKNGQVISLGSGTSSTAALAITLSGPDVYIAGYEYNGTVSLPKFWKNGTGVTLPSIGSYTATQGIAISGADIYVVGQEGNGSTYVAKLWKNGVAQTLPSTSIESYSTGVAVFGTDVFVCGYNYRPNQYAAWYWKNGLAVSLPGTVARASGICLVPR